MKEAYPLHHKANAADIDGCFHCNLSLKSYHAGKKNRWLICTSSNVVKNVCICFPVVPHRRTQGPFWESGGDRRHSHAARFPAPAAGRDTPPGGETQIQQRAGQQELAYTRSTCQAQLHRLARRSDMRFYLNIYQYLQSWRLSEWAEFKKIFSIL